MIEYAADSNAPVKIPKPHDPDSEQFYTMVYRAPVWVADTIYREKAGSSEVGDIVSPLSANGFYYECVSGGVSGSAEPAFETARNELIIDGGVIWKAVPNDCELGPLDTIALSTWVADGATLDGTVGVIFAGGSATKIKVLTVVDGIRSFRLTNTLTITRENGDVETDDFSMIVKIQER
jgi:hypothetical protein